MHRMQPPSLDIIAVRRHGRLAPVRDLLVLDRPWSSLRHYAKSARRPQPKVLVVAPLSGHFGWLMRDAVVGLLANHDVFLLEWRNASFIPAAAGILNLGSAIGAVIEAINALGPKVTLFGVSQAATLVLSAAALMAAERHPNRPAAVVALGGFLDTRQHPTGIELLAGKLPSGWFSRVVAEVVPPDAPGAGRHIYPASTHAQALQRYLSRHMSERGELYHKMTADDGEDPERFPFARLYSTLMDLPAEYAEDNARKVFAEAHLPRGLLTWKGRPVLPEHMRDIGLMTVEGGVDDSSGQGQTHAAHELCPNLPAHLRRRHDEPGAGHFGLFHGAAWRGSILPRIEEFIAETAFR